MLFTAPGVDKHIAGVILNSETVRDSARDGTSFVKVLQDRGIYAGIKLDLGVTPILGTGGHVAGETFTMGLHELDESCKAYYEMGCRFAKWRSVFKIGKGTPSDAAI